MDLLSELGRCWIRTKRITSGDEQLGADDRARFFVQRDLNVYVMVIKSDKNEEVHEVSGKRYWQRFVRVVVWSFGIIMRMS